MEKENKEGKEIINDNKNEALIKEEKIFNLVSSVFQDKSKRNEIIEKLRPFFALKVVPNRDIQKVYSSIEKLNPENIDLIEDLNIVEDKYSSYSTFETKSKSVGLSDFDLDLSVSIFGQKQSAKYENKDEKNNEEKRNTSRIHCIYSVVVNLFRIVIDFQEIKLAKQVKEELTQVQNSNATEKKVLLEKLIEKFGLYIPLEIIVGGRINYFFDASSSEEIREAHSILKSEVEAKFSGKAGFFASGNLDINYNKKNSKDNYSNSLNKIQNLSMKMEGGDYTYRNDFGKWCQSFNLDNLQIVEYKTIIPIYCFISGLESKLSICLQKYEDIVFKEINNLIETEYSLKDEETFQDTCENKNCWKVGITSKIYKSFIIYQRKINKTIRLESLEKKESIHNFLYKNFYSEDTETQGKRHTNEKVSGQVPDGFIICGWVIKTNANSKPYDVVCSWEKKKGLKIIGNDCYNFNFDVSFEGDQNQDVEIDWNIEIYCIHSDFLVPYEEGKFSTHSKIHYFSNCDCNIINNYYGYCEDCFYNRFFTKKDWFTFDKIEYEKTRKIKRSKKGLNNLF